MVQPLVVIGLDCATPQLFFDDLAAEMPTVSALRAAAAWGPLRSVDPPITVPAWACMMSGLTPGQLGVYGFRDRRAYDYGPLRFATSRDIRRPRLWDLMSRAGRRSVVLGMPGTYPPAPIEGDLVSCFLAPSTEVRYTAPAELQAEIERVSGGYLLDVEDFRSDDLDAVGQRIFDLTEQRFAVARHLATSRPWELFAFVDMGPDRLHHAFWKYCDPAHPRHEPGNRWSDVFRTYYRALDAHLAGFLEVLPDDAIIMVVSDHGAQPMLGGFCVNEWLRAQGLLVLRQEPDGPTPVSAAAVDWSRTTAWAEGGYYGRIFLNVAGREPTGVVPATQYDSVLDSLASALERILGPDGAPMGTVAMRPRDLYPEVNGIAPDLLVYFGGLRWRALATLGLPGGLYQEDNDTGPDHANHAESGVLLLHGAGLAPGERTGLSLYDVAPTLQNLLGIDRQAGQAGAVIR